ncbi:MAG: putative rane protein [Sphingomonadales bacterium]|nr:putative rane protein [Sphingomonadales bacterium]
MKHRILLALALAPLAATAATAAPPRAFLADAGKGDNSEIELGRLAEQRGASNAAREAGRMLQRDHGASKRVAAPLLRRLAVPPPVGVTPEARAEMRRLQGLRGRAFDAEFARFSVAEHQKDIAKFQVQARTGDRVTAAFARAQLPVLRHHLQMARDLLRAR